MYLWEPLSAQQLSHGEATGHSKCVWLLCASRVTTPQWLGSELPQWWSATLCGVAVETWGGKKGDNKMVLNSEHPELTKNQKQWTWGVSDGGSPCCVTRLQCCLNSWKHTCALHTVNAAATTTQHWQTLPDRTWIAVFLLYGQRVLLSRKQNHLIV